MHKISINDSIEFINFMMSRGVGLFECGDMLVDLENDFSLGQAILKIKALRALTRGKNYEESEEFINNDGHVWGDGVVP